MYSIDMKDMSWKVVKSYDFDDKLVHDDYVNPDLIHQVYVAQMSNERYPLASTKTRWQVHGSRKKLYRQKGTGSARVGNKQSPIRRGGWVAFGPTSARNYTKKINKKMSRASVRALLTVKAQEKEIVWITNLAFDVPKTKNAINVLDALSIGTKVLLVMWSKNEAIEKSFRNIPHAKYILASYLNPRDLMHYDTLLIMEDAMDHMSHLYTQ